MGQFPLLTLQDILCSKILVDKKLEIYVKQCQKHNIVWIQGIISQVHRIFNNNKIDIKLKVHSLYLLKTIVLTCQYSVLYLTEVYLLNFLVQIVEFYSKNMEIKMNSKYFQSLGYPTTYSNIQQLSHNYIILSIDILHICAILRSKETFQNKELRKNSNFYSSISKLKQKNSKLFNEAQLQEKFQIKNLKLKYLNELQKFEENNYFYIDFYMKKLQNWIFSSQISPSSQNLDFKILFKKGDVYLTSESIARLAQIIDFVDDLKIKNKALSCLNQFILWGDIEAVVTVNYTEYFQKIFKQVFAIDGRQGLKKGQQIFPLINGQFEQKRKFYSDFLRCVNIWADIFPTEQSIFYQKDENQDLSPINKNYRFLKMVKKFIFPQNPFLQKIKVEIRENLRLNSQRNKCILDQLNDQLNQVQQLYKITFKQIKQEVNLVQKNLLKLKQAKEKIEERKANQLMNFLVKFSENFQLQLERITQNIKNQELDQIIQKGLIFIQVISIISSQYQKYKKGKIKIKDFFNYCSKAIDTDYFTGKRVIQNINSSKSILNRKSQIRQSINSNISKSRDSLSKSRQTIKYMTEQTRIRIIKKQYLNRMQKLANRTNSERDDSFLNASGFLNRSVNSKSFNKLPLQSKQQLQDRQNKELRQIKSNQKYEQKSKKNSRQIGKKVFVVSKYIQSNESVTLSTIKNEIIAKNWNSNKQIPQSTTKSNNDIKILEKQRQSSQKNYHFSFVDEFLQKKSDLQTKCLNQQKNSHKESAIQKQMNFIYNNSSTKETQFQGLQSPQFGNTEIKQNIEVENRKKIRKGVGLAKKFINLTQKLIGPEKQIITFSDFEKYFSDYKNSKVKKNMLSKLQTIIQNELIQVDRVTNKKQGKLEIIFYIVSKAQINNIRIKISETPSIYLNVLQNPSMMAQKHYYQFKNLKPNEQHSFELVGSLLKSPIIMPQIQIKVNEDIYKSKIPFPLLYMIQFKKPQSKWLGKDYDLANKILSQQFTRNKEILSKFQDLQDYFPQFSYIRTDKNIKRYRTEGFIQTTNFVLEIKQIQNRVSLSCVIINQTSQKELVQFFISECMIFFS